jgi:hypothetical protein
LVGPVHQSYRLALLDPNVADLRALQLPRPDAEQIEQLDECPLRRVLHVLHDGVELFRRDIPASRLLGEVLEREARQIDA